MIGTHLVLILPVAIRYYGMSVVHVSLTSRAASRVAKSQQMLPLVKLSVQYCAVLTTLACQASLCPKP